MKGMKGIFEDRNNNDNRKKTRKVGKIIHNRIVGMFKGDELREVNHNVIISNTQPNQYQKGVTKNKHKNKNIKYKNNKKKKRKKEKSRVQ